MSSMQCSWCLGEAGFLFLIFLLFFFPLFWHTLKHTSTTSAVLESTDGLVLYIGEKYKKQNKQKNTQVKYRRGGKKCFKETGFEPFYRLS